MSKPKEFIDSLNTSETVFGLDFGDKTIGIAVSDKTLSIASPITTIKRKSYAKDLDALFLLIKEYDVGGLVFGLPLSLNGQENESITVRWLRVNAKFRPRSVLEQLTDEELHEISDIIIKNKQK